MKCNHFKLRESAGEIVVTREGWSRDSLPWTLWSVDGQFASSAWAVFSNYFRMKIFGKVVEKCIQIKRSFVFIYTVILVGTVCFIQKWDFSSSRVSTSAINTKKNWRVCGTWRDVILRSAAINSLYDIRFSIGIVFMSWRISNGENKLSSGNMYIYTFPVITSRRKSAVEWHSRFYK